MLPALDHLLGTSYETLIGFEDEAEVENPDCVHRPKVNSTWYPFMAVSLRGRVVL
ncbi:hypothetical protein ARMGADRAFT_1086318 [Armillaria gallica]|uniref:Uncharacterized protein n=1 Tax=Armillaria gallica TaxID=47427 RepID=A0A2H3D7L4_ARMGA|nr:hypothetical protein ARMGADRAFT_1086318 [Armillaria gallica]